MTFVVAGVPLLLAALTAAALALVVFAHGPGRTVNRCLSALLLVDAAFAFGSAMAAFTSADLDSLRANVWLQWVYALAFHQLLAIPLALSWPERRRWAAKPFASLWPYALAWVFLACIRAVFDTTSNGLPHDLLSASGAIWAVNFLVWFAGWGIALMLVVEARHAPAGPLRDGRILLALGLSLLSVNVAFRDAASIGRWLDALPVTGSIGWLWMVANPVGVLATGVILWHIWRIRHSRAARLARWLVPIAAISGLADPVLAYAQDARLGPLVLGYETRFFLYAFWMLLPMALLAYVVLKGQIEGLDVKVRFAISKSTVAAVFIAVFFIASEAAQQFFGETSGSAYLGIAAAGALVFAIAPLQRVAERLAERAVPVPTPVYAGTVPPLAAAAYRRTVRLVLANGALSPEQEVELARVAHDLGLSAPDATRIRFEAEHATPKHGGEAP